MRWWPLFVVVNFRCVCVLECVTEARMKKCTMNKRNDETKWLSHNIFLASKMLLYVFVSV